MGSLKAHSGYAYEITTEILDEVHWWQVVRAAIEHLRRRGSVSVSVEYGFVLDLDLKGKIQGRDRAGVPIHELEPLIRQGLDEGTIERVGASDFVFEGEGAKVGVMLCNEADIHFGSHDAAAIEELRDLLAELGITVPREIS